MCCDASVSSSTYFSCIFHAPMLFLSFPICWFSFRLWIVGRNSYLPILFECWEFSINVVYCMHRECSRNALECVRTSNANAMQTHGRNVCVWSLVFIEGENRCNTIDWNPVKWRKKNIRILTWHRILRSKAIWNASTFSFYSINAHSACFVLRLLVHQAHNKCTTCV